MRHLDLLRRFLFFDNWMKELGSEVAGGSEDFQQTQPKTTNPIVRTGRPVSTEQTSSSSAQEIDKRFLLGCESTNEGTGRLVKNCVPVSVERSGQDKDADENVDADQVRTVGPVFVHTARGNRHRLQSVWIATCSCETSRKLPCSRTREEDREPPSSTSASRRFAAKQRLHPNQ